MKLLLVRMAMQFNTQYPRLDNVLHFNHLGKGKSRGCSSLSYHCTLQLPIYRDMSYLPYPRSIKLETSVHGCGHLPALQCLIKTATSKCFCETSYAERCYSAPQHAMRALCSSPQRLRPRNASR